MPNFFAQLLEQAHHILRASNPSKDVSVPSSTDSPSQQFQSIVEEAEVLLDNDEFDAVIDRFAPYESFVQNNSHALSILGRASFFIGRYEDAARHLERACQLDRTDSINFKFLAGCRLSMGNASGAIAAASDALLLKLKDAELENMMATAYGSLKQFDASAHHCARAVELAPGNPQYLVNLALLAIHLKDQPRWADIVKPRLSDLIMRDHPQRTIDTQVLSSALGVMVMSKSHFGLALDLAKTYAKRSDLELDAVTKHRIGLAFFNAGQLQPAMEMYRAAFEQTPDEVDIRIGLAFTYIIDGKDCWAQGWDLAQTWRHLNPHDYETRVPIWSGDRTQGHRILIYQEQGLGDALLALRFIPIIASMGYEVVLWVRPALLPLAKSVAGPVAYIESATRPDPREHRCTAAAALLSLVHVLKLTPSHLKRDTAYIAPSTDSVQRWATRISPHHGVKIGLAWAGNPNRLGDDWMRSLPADEIAKFSEILGVAWFNLSIDRRPEQRVVSESLGLIDFTAELADFGETAALITNLDAVICIDCSVAHVAGALGKPGWVLAPSFLDWRWQIDDDLTPWHQTLTVVRADAPGLFEDALMKVRRDVAAFVRTRTETVVKPSV